MAYGSKSGFNAKFNYTYSTITTPLKKGASAAPHGSMGGNAKLGSGERFANLKSKLAHQPGITNPGALAASIGRKKYGKAKFQKLAAKGKPGY